MWRKEEEHVLQLKEKKLYSRIMGSKSVFWDLILAPMKILQNQKKLHVALVEWKPVRESVCYLMLKKLADAYVDT